MGIGEIILLMGIPTAITGFFFWLIEHRIQKREKVKEAEAAERRRKAAEAEAERRRKIEEREKAREDLELMLIAGNGAAIALAEATAKAVQRIPDAHCNGDMHDALEYAAKVKHQQKDFLTRLGIQAILEE